MTDEVVTFAVSDAKERSGEIAGSLVLSCNTHSAKILSIPEHLYVSIQLSEDMPEGGTIVSWRIDQQPVQKKSWPQLRSTSMVAIDQFSPEALRRAKRVRVQWARLDGPLLFYDFDVAGVDKVMSQIPCGKRSSSERR
jgi:hypothetical protein